MVLKKLMKLIIRSKIEQEKKRKHKSSITRQIEGPLRIKVNSQSKTVRRENPTFTRLPR